jgi:hypothetical protein
MVMNLNMLIEETYKRCNEINDNNYTNMLLTILKENHYWPSIKVKKFKNEPDLCLLHNSYKSDEIEVFKELYDECRSVILDFSKKFGDNVVISYANSIPIRSSIDNYIHKICDINNDICKRGMDGTLITVYNHNGKWYFGSSCCPDINSSKFSHPTKTHGDMMDEVLSKNSLTRDLFTSNLSPLYSYEFVLVHHEDKHICNYDEELGENYKYLYHINSKNRLTLKEEVITNKPLEYLGIRYMDVFRNANDAIEYLNNNPMSFIIVKKEQRLYKVSTDKILHLEEVNANNYNIWYNLIYVYMLQKPNYNINEYLKEFIKEDEIEVYKDSYENINMIFKTICDLLYNLYVATTNYYPKYKRFKVNLDLDKTLAPVFRFHLAQLRYKQVSLYTKGIIKQEEVFKYLCHSNNIKNIKKIIVHLSMAKNKYDIPSDVINKIVELNKNL